jgi:hypothetical protein
VIVEVPASVRVEAVIVTADLTARLTHDCTQVPALLEQIDNPVVTLSADGAYDSLGVYEAAQTKGGGRVVRVLIPPERNAKMAPRPSAASEERNRNILSIRESGRRLLHTGPQDEKRTFPF